MLGGSFVGLPHFMYARSPHGAFGATSLNPDVMDIFIDDVKEIEGREVYYDAKDQTYKEFEVIEETIKVRFGRDVKLQIKHTANGVVLPTGFLDNKANDVVVWAPREIIPSASE